MTPEEKELLLKDLCGRLPYGIKTSNGHGILKLSPRTDIIYIVDNGHIPYLRPMSSMTEGEKKELKELCKEDLSEFAKFICDGHGLSHDGLYMFDKLRQLDFLNSHHLDYRGLIEEDLAIEAPEDMYKNE